jgi:hypothetical protein
MAHTTAPLPKVHSDREAAKSAEKISFQLAATTLIARSNRGTTMVFSSFLDRWDEAQAAEDDRAKAAEQVALGASLAFDEASEVDFDTFQHLARKHCEDSDKFYAPSALIRDDLGYDGDQLTFPSAILTETPANNLVRARVMTSCDPGVSSTLCSSGLSLDRNRPRTAPKSALPSAKTGTPS